MPRLLGVPRRQGKGKAADVSECVRRLAISGREKLRVGLMRVSVLPRVRGAQVSARVVFTAHQSGQRNRAPPFDGRCGVIVEVRRALQERFP